MIVPDINLLIYAYNEDAPVHQEARMWWEGLLNDSIPVGIPWIVSSGFVRLMSNPRVLEIPMKPATALEHVISWLECLHVNMVDPGHRQMAILRELFGAVQVGGNLTTDAHIAALAMEQQATVHSNDTDFGRFPGCRWHNPIAG